MPKVLFILIRLNVHQKSTDRPTTPLRWQFEACEAGRNLVGPAERTTGDMYLLSDVTFA